MNLRIFTLMTACAALLCAPMAFAQFEFVGSVTLTWFLLQRSGFGCAFASGVPRYFVRDEIERSSVSWDGSPLADRTYCSAQPMQPGIHVAVFHDSTTSPRRAAIRPPLASVSSTWGACRPFCAALGALPPSFWI
jgi:hypothetical protein